MTVRLGTVAWRPESEKRARRLGAVLLIGAVVVMLVLLLWQGVENKKALASYAIGPSNGVYALETLSGFLTFRALGDGKINVCEPGAQCFKLELEKPVYMIRSIRLNGQLIVFSYIAIGESTTRSAMRALYDLKDRLSRVEPAD